MQSSEVITKNESSELLDPLADYSTLSLFKQSLNLSSSSSSTSNSSIFDSLHTNLKHRVLRSPDKLLKQTTTILEGSLDVSKTDKTEHVFTENEKVPRERRPDLGIGRAKFTLKPLPSQPAVNLEPSIDFDKLTDPDEYFDAFERMQKAKKEVRRLNGEPLLDLDLNNASFAPRPRRPSLLGKKAIYTHRTYPSVSTAAVDETLLPSQETINNHLRGSTCSDVVADATIVNKSSSMRMSGSKAATNSKVTELDELLSLNYEGLDEDGVQNLIQDKLQIKSVDIGKALLPDWSFPLRESFSSRVTLPKMDETGFCLRSVNKTASSKDKKSPTKSTGLLASLSKLNRHIKEATPSTGLFSPRRINLSPKETTSPSRESEKRVDQVGLSDEVDAMKSLCKERKSSAHGEEHTLISVEAPIFPVEMDINQANEPKEKEVVGKSDQIGAMTSSCELGRSPEPGEVTAVSSQGSFDSVVKDVDLTIEPKEKEKVVGKSDQIDTRTGLCESGKSPVHEEERILVPDVGLTEEPENQESEQLAAAQESVRQKLIFEENLSFNGVEIGGTSEPLSTENNPGEELTKKSLGSFKRKYKEKGKPKAPSEAAVSEKVQATTSQPDVSVPIETGIKRRKVDGAQPRPGKNDGRFSLNYAGTKWEDGIRRSTRIRMRPLEYWNGERFLYGRVHNSLVTVIGVKYASPSKETEVKVQSFVSDEYKHLVERASLY